MPSASWGCASSLDGRTSALHATLSLYLSLRAYTILLSSLASKDLYASAVGTTVLQLREIPPRPKEYDGKICLFLIRDSSGKPQDIDEARIRNVLSKYGEILDCELTGPLRDNQGGYIISFATHEAALAAKRGGPIPGVCAGVDTLYNERSYDGRKGEEGCEDDEGRGW